MKISEVIEHPSIKAIAYDLQQQLVELEREVTLSSVYKDGKLISIRLDVAADPKLKEDYSRAAHCLEVYQGPQVSIAASSNDGSSSSLISNTGKRVSVITEGLFFFSAPKFLQKKYKLAPPGKTNFDEPGRVLLVSFVETLETKDIASLMNDYKAELW